MCSTGYKIVINRVLGKGIGEVARHTVLPIPGWGVWMHGELTGRCGWLGVRSTGLFFQGWQKNFYNKKIHTGSKTIVG